jgi:hypothetical protein
MKGAEMFQVSSRSHPIMHLAERSSEAVRRYHLQCCICISLWSSEQLVGRPCFFEMLRSVLCVLIFFIAFVFTLFLF